MPFTVQCSYTPEAFRALFKAPVKRKKQQIILQVVFFAWLAVVFVVNELFLESFGITLVLIFLLVLMLCYSPLIRHLVPKKLYRNYEKLGKYQVTFCFTETEFTETSIAADITSQCRLRYTALSRVRESPEYFFLYRWDDAVYIVPKASISPAQGEALRAVLQAWIVEYRMDSKK